MPGVERSPIAKQVLAEAQRFEVELAKAQGLQIAEYLALIAHWNPRVRLVGRSDPDTLVQVHLADALALAKAMEGHPRAGELPLRLVDVGSGAGLPGFALRMILPSAEISLCEISEKRVSFLFEAERRLGVGVEILAMRAQDLASSGRRFPHVVSRATFEPSEWRTLGRQLSAEGGLVWSLWTEEQEQAFLTEDLYRFRYRLRDGRSRVISAFQTS